MATHPRDESLAKSLGLYATRSFGLPEPGGKGPV
jgi:hypothetical protein